MTLTVSVRFKTQQNKHLYNQHYKNNNTSTKNTESKDLSDVGTVVLLLSAKIYFLVPFKLRDIILQSIISVTVMHD